MKYLFIILSTLFFANMSWANIQNRLLLGTPITTDTRYSITSNNYLLTNTDDTKKGFIKRTFEAVKKLKKKLKRKLTEGKGSKKLRDRFFKIALYSFLILSTLLCSPWTYTSTGFTRDRFFYSTYDLSIKLGRLFFMLFILLFLVWILLI